MVRHSSGEEPATVSAPMAPPALATRTSQRSRDPARASTAGRSVTSSRCASACPPRSLICFATSSIRSVRRAASTTKYPASASLAAVAAPIPLLAPVTTAVRCMGEIVPVAAGGATPADPGRLASHNLLDQPSRMETMATITIEPMAAGHAAAVLAIYQAGIDEGDATFEERAPAWDEFTAARLPEHRHVALASGNVVGWVAACAVSSRCVYAGVVEHSVYVDPAARGGGIGRQLLNAL